MARKKQVPDHYNPDSNRIFDREVGDDSIGDTRMNKLHINRVNPPPPPHPREPERRNCPHPWHSRFLRNNVRLLNEPICLMATESTDPEQDSWWPSRTSNEPLKKPQKTADTIQRSDYQHSAPVRGNTRHSSNPFTIPSKGILPVNEPKKLEDPGDILLESVSYRHGYNSRLERNEPIRGKLHGSFVWNQVVETDKGKVIVTPWNRRHLHRCVTVPVTKMDQAQAVAAPSDQNVTKGNTTSKKEPKGEVKDENASKESEIKDEVGSKKEPEPQKESANTINGIESGVKEEGNTKSGKDDTKSEKEANGLRNQTRIMAAENGDTPPIEEKKMKSGKEDKKSTKEPNGIKSPKKDGEKKAEAIPPIDGLPAPSGA